MLDVSGSTEPAIYAYDALYRLSSLEDGGFHTTHYYYNQQGYLDSVTYPDPCTVIQRRYMVERNWQGQQFYAELAAVPGFRPDLLNNQNQR
jgi:YD repeat-containing protein